MRVLLPTVMAAFALCAPSALACQLANPPPALPKIFWQNAAQIADLRPGMIVVKVVWIRDARMVDRNDDHVIIAGCGPTHRIYRIVRVLAGDIQEQQEILVPAGYDFNSDLSMLVGRLITQNEVGWAEHIGLDANLSLLVLQPELPPQ